MSTTVASPQSLLSKCYFSSLSWMLGPQEDFHPSSWLADDYSDISCTLRASKLPSEQEVPGMLVKDISQSFPPTLEKFKSCQPGLEPRRQLLSQFGLGKLNNTWACLVASWHRWWWKQSSSLILQRASEPSGELSKMQVSGPGPQDFWFTKSRWEVRICISNWFTGDAADQGTTPWEDGNFLTFQTYLAQISAGISST